MRSYVESLSFASFAASFAMSTSSRSTVDVIWREAAPSVQTPPHARQASTSQRDDARWSGARHAGHGA
jgi:hypothetical protein